MSELKVYRDPKDGPAYREFYEKSEADKVIADKDKEIQRLENLCESYRIDCDNLAISEANAYKEIERDNKRIRHQKYKRCLAMAKWCDARYDAEDAKVNGCGASWEYISKEMKYWERWQWRWEALAEEPTWKKFLQLIHKEAK